jgi:cytosine/adenosine deaminase-related metal-dependent hydrolase
VSVTRARWVLPIDRPPIENGWMEVIDGRIARVGDGTLPGTGRDLGDVALLPGLVNAHTHLELSWMAGHITPAESMDAWIHELLRLRRTGAPSETVQTRAADDAAVAMRTSGTVLVGDVSNSLVFTGSLARARLGGVVFYELLGFKVEDPARLVRQAYARADQESAVLLAAGADIRVTPAAHAPYSVSPALFREIAARSTGLPLTVHVGESPEELEFLRTGQGAIRHLLEQLGVWTDAWQAPGCDPVEYLHRVGYLHPGLLAVHAVHLSDDALVRLARAGAIVVTCPRSNIWVGAGMPRVSHFYAAGVPVAIGTDSLASTASLNLFDELAELRRIAPDVAASSLLESATRVGADALGFGATHGTIAPGKGIDLIAVDLPPGVTDVEEYLVGGVPPEAVRHVFD